MRDTLYSHSSIDCKIVYRLYQGWHMEEMPALACLAFAHMWRDRLLPCCHATRPRVLSMATCGSCPVLWFRFVLPPVYILPLHSFSKGGAFYVVQRIRGGKGIRVLVFSSLLPRSASSNLRRSFSISKSVIFLVSTASIFEIFFYRFLFSVTTIASSLRRSDISDELMKICESRDR